MSIKFLLKKARGNGVSPIELFNYFDANGDGEIDVEEFSSAMARFSINATSREVKAVMVRDGSPLAARRRDTSE